MAWTASTWKLTVGCFSNKAEMSLMGWIEPISLLAAMMETRIVSGRIKSASFSTSTKPSLVTGARSTSNPWLLSQRADSLTAGCSMLDTMTCFPKWARSKATPLITQLSPSVPPEVKKISDDFSPSKSAICLREASRMRLAWLPRLWRLEGLPQILLATSV